MEKCLFYSLFSAPLIQAVFDLSRWKIPCNRNQTLRAFGGGGEEKKRSLTWLIVSWALFQLFYFFFYSNPAIAWLLSCSRKRRKSTLLPVEALQPVDGHVVIVHVWKTYGLQAPATERRSPPAIEMWAQSPDFHSARPETRSKSSSCLRAASSGCLQSKSNHIWLGAKSRKPDCLSPPIQWEMAGWGEKERRSEKLTRALKMLWNCNMHL